MMDTFSKNIITHIYVYTYSNCNIRRKHIHNNRELEHCLRHYLCVRSRGSRVNLLMVMHPCYHLEIQSLYSMHPSVVANSSSQGLSAWVLFNFEKSFAYRFFVWYL